MVHKLDYMIFCFSSLFFTILKERVYLLNSEIITPEQLQEAYKDTKLIPVTSLAQVKFYVEHGVQPLLVYPSERADIMAFWYPKKDTYRLYVDYRKYINDKYQVGE